MPALVEITLAGLRWARRRAPLGLPRLLIHLFLLQGTNLATSQTTQKLNSNLKNSSFLFLFIPHFLKYPSDPMLSFCGSRLASQLPHLLAAHVSSCHQCPTPLVGRPNLLGHSWMDSIGLLGWCRQLTSLHLKYAHEGIKNPVNLLVILHIIGGPYALRFFQKQYCMDPGYIYLGWMARMDTLYTLNAATQFQHFLGPRILTDF
ncbi:hypothetical protein EJ08DRAFT_387324 [Tothia fuscella]|uniref:Uncharacterized protein n=1 Tax=Tothia fuscella TaxID=1048955 RepID=A0A9P4U3H4_9PEZI|nr:hypothetical protein EJ08DRAFT_387324 [Tothia fuscella]